MSSQTSKVYRQQSFILRAETSYNLLRRDSRTVEADTIDVERFREMKLKWKLFMAIPSSTHYVLLSDIMDINVTCAICFVWEYFT